MPQPKFALWHVFVCWGCLLCVDVPCKNGGSMPLAWFLLWSFWCCIENVIAVGYILSSKPLTLSSKPLTLPSKLMTLPSKPLTLKANRQCHATNVCCRSVASCFHASWLSVVVVKMFLGYCVSINERRKSAFVLFLVFWLAQDCGIYVNIIRWRVGSGC